MRYLPSHSFQIVAFLPLLRNILFLGRARNVWSSVVVKENDFSPFVTCEWPFLLKFVVDLVLRVNNKEQPLYPTRNTDFLLWMFDLGIEVIATPRSTHDFLCLRFSYKIYFSSPVTTRVNLLSKAMFAKFKLFRNSMRVLILEKSEACVLFPTVMTRIP